MRVDPGYANYQDPRLQPPPEPDLEKCGDCVYYREVYSKQKSNGMTHYIGVCVFDVFQADTFERLERADLTEVDPTEEPCRDFKEDE